MYGTTLSDPTGTVVGMSISGVALLVLGLILGLVIGLLLGLVLTRAARAQRDHAAAEFERLSQRALQDNSEAFLSSASRPLTDQLDRVQDHLNMLERRRAEADAELRQQVRAMSSASDGLRSETAQLVAALRAPHVRGRWGELQLRRVVEAAGMLRHVDFTEQQSATTSDGVQRPDLVVSLADGKQVVVDAKVAFNGYLDAVQASDEATQRNGMAAHARHLRTHIDQLASKRYWAQFSPTPEFVVMFVPAEAFLAAAVEEDPALYEHAFTQNVVLATPATLVALLRTVAYTWRQEALTENAAAVLELGRTLHSRLATMAGHVDKLGRSLDTAVRSFNDTVGSLESRVLVTARRMTDLEVVNDDVAAPSQVETQPRRAAAPEMSQHHT